MTNIDKKHAENIAAISAEFHANSGYSAFYDYFGRELNGFTGIYQYVISLAEKVTELERKHPNIFDHTNWVELVSDYTATVITSANLSGRLPNAEDILNGMTKSTVTVLDAIKENPFDDGAYEVWVGLDADEIAEMQNPAKDDADNTVTEPSDDLHQEVRVTLSMPANIETESLRRRMECAVAGEFPGAVLVAVDEERHIYGLDDNEADKLDERKAALVVGMLSDISDHKLAALDHGQLKNLITDMRNAARDLMPAPQHVPKLPKI